MKEPFKFGPANLFLTQVWVELPSDSEVALLIRPLTYAEIITNQEIAYLHSQNKDYFKTVTYQSIITPCVLDSRGAINFPTLSDLIEQLGREDLYFIHSRLMEISTVTSDQLGELGEMLDIQFSPQLRDDSWKCTTCQEKKLDYTRACGFLPEDKRDKSPLLPRIKGQRFTQCPISLLDGYIIKQASLAHSMLEAGTLPEAGGVGNQTEWFVRAAFTYKNKIAEAEREMVNAYKNK